MTDDIPEWTEGVCGDGAAILRDGEMVPIEEVVAALNRAEAARSAALEEAAAEMDHRAQVAATARDSYLKINSPDDAARHENYRVAYGSGAAAIRELKDK